MSAGRQQAGLALLWIALGLVLLERLGGQLWYDEAYTLLAYVHTGPAYALTHYTVPNNHILYSAFLGLLPAGPDWLYRLPSLVFALATVLLTGRVARRLVGPAVSPRAVSMLVLGLYLASPAFLALAPAIRGYGPSMLAAIACFSMVVGDLPPSRRWAVGYALIGAIAIGILPTNVIFLAVFAWVHIGRFRRAPTVERGSLWRLLAPHAAAAVLGGLVYLPVLDDLVEQLGRGWGEPPELAIARALLAGLMPGAAGLSLYALLRRGRARSEADQARVVGVGASLAIAIGIGATIAMSVRLQLHARSFAPLLPIVIAGVAAFSARIFERVSGCSIRAAFAVAIVGQLYWQASVAGMLRPGVSDRMRTVLPPYYTARGFDPWDAARLLEKYLVAEPDGLVIVDGRLYAPPPAPLYSDPFAIYYQLVAAGLDDRYHEVSAWDDVDELAASLPDRCVFVIARDAAGLRSVCARLGVDPADAHPIKETGFYRVWRLAGPVEQIR